MAKRKRKVSLQLRLLNAPQLEKAGGGVVREVWGRCRDTGGF